MSNAALSETNADADAAARLALTEAGRRKAIVQRCDLPDFREARNDQRKALLSIYAALHRRSGPMSRRDLRDYFVPSGVDASAQGSYTSFSRWMDEGGGRANLLRLPGVAEADGGLEFIGARLEDLADLDRLEAGEHTRPLDRYRDDPRVKARNAAEDMTAPGSDELEDLLRLWDLIASVGTSGTTREELDRDRRTERLLSEYEERLAELPHIVREVEQPPDPSDIVLEELETLEDLLAAQAAHDEPPVERWRFDPDSP
jgi:hypothetical protein